MSITLEILKSPDSLIIGTWNFFADTILIGSARPADIIINDPQISNFPLWIKGYQHKLLLEGEKFSHRGVLIRGQKVITTSEEFSLENNHFRILSIQLNTANEEQIWQEKFQQLTIAEASLVFKIFNEIKKLRLNEYKKESL